MIRSPFYLFGENDLEAPLPKLTLAGKIPIAYIVIISAVISHFLF